MGTPIIIDNGRFLGGRKDHERVVGGLWEGCGRVVGGLWEGCGRVVGGLW